MTGYPYEIKYFENEIESTELLSLMLMLVYASSTERNTFQMTSCSILK